MKISQLGHTSVSITSKFRRIRRGSSPYTSTHLPVHYRNTMDTCCLTCTTIRITFYFGNNVKSPITNTLLKLIQEIPSRLETKIIFHSTSLTFENNIPRRTYRPYGSYITVMQSRLLCCRGARLILHMQQ